MTNKLLIDVNVCLDLLLKRNPHSQPAAQIFEASEKGKIQGIVSAISFDTMFYIMRQSLSSQQATKMLKDLSSIIQVGAVDGSVIASALNDGWNDLEDAIQAATASHASCDAVITRNIKDFKRGRIPAFSPAAYISTYLSS